MDTKRAQSSMHWVYAVLYGTFRTGYFTHALNDECRPILKR